MSKSTSRLPVTEHTRASIARGDLEGAKARHDATVHEAFRMAEAGGIINLSDLMASKEELIEAEGEG